MRTVSVKVLQVIMLIVMPVMIVHAIDGVKKTIIDKTLLDVIYKKVVDDLVDVGKAHPLSQSKIYSVLDALAKIQVTAEDKFDIDASCKKAIEYKDGMIVSLRQDIEALKNGHQETQKKLFDTSAEINEKLEREKQQNKILEAKIKELEKQISTLQAMSTTTTSTTDQLLHDHGEKHNLDKQEIEKLNIVEATMPEENKRA